MYRPSHAPTIAEQDRETLDLLILRAMRDHGGRLRTAVVEALVDEFAPTELSVRAWISDALDPSRCWILEGPPPSRTYTLTMLGCVALARIEAAQPQLEQVLV